MQLGSDGLGGNAPERNPAANTASPAAAIVELAPLEPSGPDPLALVPATGFAGTINSPSSPPPAVSGGASDGGSVNPSPTRPTPTPPAGPPAPQAPTAPTPAPLPDTGPVLAPLAPVLGPILDTVGGTVGGAVEATTGIVPAVTTLLLGG